MFAIQSRRRALAASAIVIAVVGGACGKSDNPVTAAPASKAAVTVGSFGFPESVALANIYADALKKDGFPVTVKANLGSREVVEPAFEKGEIDIVPEYAGNALAFLAPDASKPGDDLNTTLTKLRDAFKPKNITVLDPSPAEDGDSIGVTRATADKYHLAKISDLAPVASQLVLGGPPECATRITCKLGLEQVYGLKFKDFKALDADGPLTRAALDKGDIQLARLFSADGDLQAKGYVILQDDKHIQPAGNVVPVVRAVKVTDELTRVLNKVSSTMTTPQLIEINQKMSDQKKDPAAVADEWVKEYLK